jgi:hypothetical protein
VVVKLWALNIYAFLPCFLQDGRNSFFVDRLDGCRRYLERYPAIFFRDVEALFLNINLKASFSLVMGVRDMISRYWTFSGQLVST